MNHDDDRERIGALLREAMAPAERTELERDLWPRMLRRLDERPIRPTFVDWILAATGLGWAALYPTVIPALLYQL
jgi:hypothetical protein